MFCDSRNLAKSYRLTVSLWLGKRVLPVSSSATRMFYSTIAFWSADITLEVTLEMLK